MGTEVSEHSSVPFSEMKYLRGPGTKDSGRDYEFKMLTLLALRFAVEDGKDMWLATNAKDVGKFDDIILHSWEPSGNSTTYMLQLKHQNSSKNIGKEEFTPNSKQGHFSLFKYADGFNDLKKALQDKSSNTIVKYFKDRDPRNIISVLFTNRGTYNHKFLENDNDPNLLLLNTNISRKNIYKFDYGKFEDDISFDNLDYCQNIRFFSNQIHENHIDEQIRREVETVIKHFGLMNSNVDDIADKFTLYIKNWEKGNLGGSFCLTKQQILFKLSELFLSSFQIDLGQAEITLYDAAQKCTWNEIVSNKIITILNSNEAVLLFLRQYIGSKVNEYADVCGKKWTDVLHGQSITKFCHNHSNKAQILKIVGNYGKIKIRDIYNCLWFRKKLPRLLKMENMQEYENIASIIKMSNYNLRVIIVNKSSELLSRIEKTAGCFYSFHDLNDQEKTKILSRHVKIQGRSSVLLSNVVDESMYEHITTNDVIYILSDDFNIGNCFDSLPDYHIERSIWKIFIQQKMLREVKDEIFLIQNATEKSFDNVAWCKLEEFDYSRNVNCNVIVLNENQNLEQIEYLKSKANAVHRLRFYDKHLLEWKESFGNVNNIRKYQLFQQHNFYQPTNLNEKIWKSISDAKFWTQLEDLLNGGEENYLGNSVHIISACAGMGKTTFLDSAALRAPLSVWVLKINLNDYDEYYNSLKDEKINLKALDHLKFFFLKSKCSNIELAAAIFNKLANNKQVVVLLDGFDEISISYKTEVIKIAKCLRSESFCFWLTTRPVMQCVLEEELKTISTSLKPFTKDDQKDFLINFFTENCTRNVSNIGNCALIIKEFVEKLLNAAKVNLNDIDNEFTEIPLHAKLLAEVFQKDCEASIKNGNVNLCEKFDLLHLYQQFIDKKFNVFYDKFCDDGKQRTRRLLEENRHWYKTHQQFLALKILFPKQDLLDLNVDQQLDQFSTNKQDETQKIQREGVVVAHQNPINAKFYIVFIHRTFSEYMAAQWLAENYNNQDPAVNKTVEILTKRRQEPQHYKFLFNIFDRMLAKKSPLHLHIINGQIDEAHTIIKSNPENINEVDDGGRSVLHLIALHGAFHSLVNMQFINGSVHYNLMDSMVNIIETIPGSIIKKIGGDNLSHSPLYYAIISGSHVIANKICEKSFDIEIENYICTSLKYKYFELCTMLNCKALFKVLLPHFALRDILLRNINKEATILSYCTPTNVNNIDRNCLLKYINEIGVGSLSELLNLNDGFYEDLRLAVIFGKEDNLKFCLNRNVEINKRDIDGNTVLHYAIIHERLSIVKILLDRGAGVNKSGKENYTALHFGAQSGNNDLVLELLSRGANINKVNNRGETPLILALLSRQKHIAKLLLSEGADYNVEDANGANALLHSAAIGANDIISLLLTLGVDVNKKRKDNHATPLYEAIGSQSKDSIKLLLSNGADVNIQSIGVAVKWGFDMLPNNVDGINKITYNTNQYMEKQSDFVTDQLFITPLHLAIVKQASDIVQIILSNGADCSIQDSYGKSSLHHAAEVGLDSIVSLFLTTNGNVNTQDIEGNTPLHSALIKGHKNIAKLILPKHRDVNIANNTGITPLHYAVEKGYNGIVKKLLLRKADINKMNNNDKNTPLHIALQLRHIRTVKLLLLRGAEVKVENYYGDSPLHYAAFLGNSDILSELVSKGADVTKRNRAGDTPLHFALGYVAINRKVVNFAKCCIRFNSRNSATENTLNKTSHLFQFDDFLNNLHSECQKSVVKILLEKGAEVNAKNGFGYTPLHIVSIASSTSSSLLEGNAEAKRNAINFYEDIAMLLLSKGADVNIRNHRGRTCIGLAADDGNFKMVTLLKRFLRANK